MIDRTQAKMLKALEDCILQMELCEKMFTDDEEFISALEKARSVLKDF